MHMISKLYQLVT